MDLEPSLEASRVISDPRVFRRRMKRKGGSVGGKSAKRNLPGIGRGLGDPAPPPSPQLKVGVSNGRDGVEINYLGEGTSLKARPPSRPCPPRA